MSTLNCPVCQETFIHVLKEIEKGRDNFKVFIDVYNPRMLIITQDEVPIAYQLPDDVDVPDEMLTNICIEYNLLRVIFIYPESLNIK